jgi:hypothetical protein
MAKRVKFNEKKYERALETLAEQLVAMAHEDYDEEEKFLLELENYTTDTIADLKDKIEKLV